MTTATSTQQELDALNAWHETYKQVGEDRKAGVECIVSAYELLNDYANQPGMVNVPEVLRGMAYESRKRSSWSWMFTAIDAMVEDMEEWPNRWNNRHKQDEQRGEVLRKRLTHMRYIDPAEDGGSSWECAFLAVFDEATW